MQSWFCFFFRPTFSGAPVDATHSVIFGENRQTNPTQPDLTPPVGLIVVLLGDEQ